MIEQKNGNKIKLAVNPWEEGSAPGQVSLGGLKAVRLKPGVICRWAAAEEESVLSLSIACDLRNDCRLVLKIGDRHSELDASYGSHAQKLRLHIQGGESEFSVLSQTGDGELWIGIEGPLEPSLTAIRADSTARLRAAEQRLKNDALAQFSWMGGCILDGLAHMSTVFPEADWDKAINNWLQYYIDDMGNLIYQDPRGSRVENKFLNIESTLPVAVMKGKRGYTLLGQYARRMWRERVNIEGMISDGFASAEGCYTIAYPMAALGDADKDKALKDAAVRQLRLRREKLFYNGSLYLREDNGKRSFRNWTRGICWYILGLYRCIEIWKDETPDDLIEHFVDRCRWIIKQQRADGLWDNFLEEEGFPPDSSGSAGIAAALAGAYQDGLLDQAALDTAERCYKGLLECLEPDGWLGSIAPNNKRGEAEQHTNRRTVEPFGLGLFAQLQAALHSIPE